MAARPPLPTPLQTSSGRTTVPWPSGSSERSSTLTPETTCCLSVVWFSGLCQASHAQYLPPSTAPIGHNTQSCNCKAKTLVLHLFLKEVSGCDSAGDQALRELPSPGKSGSVFFLSHDDRFIIKTMRKVRLVQQQNYARHLLVSHLHLLRGCHQINCKHTYWRPISKQWLFTAYALHLSQLMHCMFCTFKLHAAITTQG